MSGSNSSSVYLSSQQPLEIRLFDSLMKPVGRAVGTLNLPSLPAGLYRLELRAGASSKEQLIKVVPGQPYIDYSLFLDFESVLPLPGTSTFNQEHLEGLQALSTASSLYAELVVFLRILPSEKAPKNAPLSSARIILLDSRLKSVQGFGSSTSTTEQQGRDWRGISATLNEGGYILRITSPDSDTSVDQPIYLSKGWQTIVCIPVDGHGPRRDLASIQMLPRNQGGYLPMLELDIPLAMALEVATSGLTAGRALVPLEQIRQMLDRKAFNPMLGMIGLYCMFDPIVLTGESTMRYTLKVPADAAFVRTVINNLEQLIPGHPDVVALNNLYAQATNTAIPEVEPVTWPPMVFLGYRKLENGERDKFTTLASGSAADRIRNVAFSCGPWTAWPSEQTKGLKDAARAKPASSEPIEAYEPRGIGPRDAKSYLSNYMSRVAETEDISIDAVYKAMSKEDISAGSGLGITEVEGLLSEETEIEKT